MPKSLQHIVFCIALLAPVFSFAQLEAFKGTWISAENDIVEIFGKPGNGNYLSSKRFRDGHFELYRFSDTLSFQRRHLKPVTAKDSIPHRYDFKIFTANDSILELKPVSPRSVRYFDSIPLLRLKKLDYNVDRDFHFEKIIFYSSYMKDMGMEITNDRGIYVTTPEYNYIGKVNKKTYQRLILILETINLKMMEYEFEKSSHGEITTMIIYFNGQRKYLTTMHPPRIAEELIRYLRVVQGQAKMKTTKKHIELEK